MNNNNSKNKLQKLVKHHKIRKISPKNVTPLIKTNTSQKYHENK